MMKKVLFFLFFTALGLMAQAQKVYFIYLQSDNGIPFFARMSDKIYSSSSAGYLILSNLRDSNYVITVGVAGANANETRFNVSIHGGDRGFLIRQTDGKLALFDLQTLSLLQPVASADRGKAGQSVTRTDAFTVLLARAANDPSLLVETVREPVIADKKPSEVQKVETVTAKAEEKPATVSAMDTVSSSPDITQIKTPEEKKVIIPESETASANDTPTANKDKKAVMEAAVEVKDIVQQVVRDTIAGTFRKSVITRYSESSTTEGFGLVFLDQTATSTDTIRIVIPHPKVFAEITDQKKGVAVADVDTVLAPPVSVLVKERPFCAAVANDEHFIRLRKAMAARSTDASMIAEAKKHFRRRCFTTAQIRNLSMFFETSSAKFEFFDAAYLHVADQQSFAALKSEIRDEYYARRFQALVKE